jgi:tRNA-modifying protein YgfZ
MMAELRDLQSISGESFIIDRTPWGRIQVSGGDRTRFLHNQTTNDFNSLKPGQGCDTVFVTSTGRTIDLTSAYVTEDAVILLVSPGYAAKLVEWMDRFIFFADKVELQDVTDATVTYTLIGGNDILARLGGADLIELLEQPYGSHRVIMMNNISVRVAIGSGLASPGYTLIADAADGPALWQSLIQAGASPDADWETWRIQQGRPMPGAELTDDINPLEAGLWQTISLSKGCYIGQETIARLHTYRGVKQQLWGVRLSAAVEPNTPVTAEAAVEAEAEAGAEAGVEAGAEAGAKKIGHLTSCTSAGDFGLAYIRTKAAAPGLKVQVGEVTGELVAVPFVSHEYL